jgi:hypothetical protein
VILFSFLNIFIIAALKSLSKGMGMYLSGGVLA